MRKIEGNCLEPGCDRPLKARHLCNTHYAAQRRRGLFGAAECSEEGCRGFSHTKGLCNKHYLLLRAREKGVETRPASNPAYYTTSKGYRARKVSLGSRNKVRYEWEHRNVMAEYIGRELLPDEEVHHINGVRDDNRIENLELWSTKQPKGQRVEDKLDWAYEMIRRYAPDEVRDQLLGPCYTR